uniref:F3 n=1 Tax=Helicobacter pylori TaxID=210 RepID=Q3LR54_HELPX|nr:F3 [Helicobacter pylori]ABQ18303.1 hypothetical protein [Cloning vector pTM117]
MLAFRVRNMQKHLILFKSGVVNLQNDPTVIVPELIADQSFQFKKPSFHSVFGVSFSDFFVNIPCYELDVPFSALLVGLFLFLGFAFGQLLKVEINVRYLAPVVAVSAFFFVTQVFKRVDFMEFFESDF